MNSPEMTKIRHLPLLLGLRSRKVCVLKPQVVEIKPVALKTLHRRVIQVGNRSPPSQMLVMPSDHTSFLCPVPVHMDGMTTLWVKC